MCERCRRRYLSCLFVLSDFMLFKLRTKGASSCAVEGGANQGCEEDREQVAVGGAAEQQPVRGQSSDSSDQEAQRRDAFSGLVASSQEGDSQEQKGYGAISDRERRWGLAEMDELHTEGRAEQRGSDASEES